jgi:WD40 repeat protein
MPPIVAAGRRPVQVRKGQDPARLWDTRTGKPIATLTGHTDLVEAVAFSPDGTTLATASNDHTARLWNARTGKPIATLTGHTDLVEAVAFSPDGTTLATASNDHTARLWNAGYTDTVAFSPDENTLATGSDGHTALFLTAIPSPNKQTDMICTAVNRTLTSQEWSQYLPKQPYERICQH